MAPTFSVYNAPYVSPTDSIFTCYFEESFSNLFKLPYSNNIRFGQLCATIKGALSKAYSATNHHVSCVFSLGSKFQVIGISARRIVAFVEYKKIFWNFSSENSVRYSMGGFLSILFYPNLSISKWRLVTAHNQTPALIYPFYFLSESVRYCFSHDGPPCEV